MWHAIENFLSDASRSGMDAGDCRARLNRRFLLYLWRDQTVCTG